MFVLSVYCFFFCHTKSAVVNDLRLVINKIFKKCLVLIMGIVLLTLREVLLSPNYIILFLEVHLSV